MNIFLTLAYLFFLGSVFGWILELFFRKFFSKSNPQHKWINPGFCTGPYLPLYGSGLCVLYVIASMAAKYNLGIIWMLVITAISMTVIEYFAGLIALKCFKLRLWDYSNLWGNFQGLICPLFSFFWAVLGAAYIFCVHPYILEGLKWLSENLAFSFVIGFFFGVFTLDVAHSANLVAKFRKFASDKEIEFERIKSHLLILAEREKTKRHFFRAFKTEFNIAEAIKEYFETHDMH